MATSSSKLEGFLKVNIRDFLRSEDDISKIHQIMVLHPPQKKWNFYILLPKIVSTLFFCPIFTQFQGEKPTGWDPTTREVSQNTTTTKSCQASARHHHAILWKCLTTHQGGAFSRGTCWRSHLLVFLSNQMEILRHVGNLINHLILHPHPIYEQSISTNSFPASNTA